MIKIISVFLLLLTSPLCLPDYKPDFDRVREYLISKGNVPTSLCIPGLLVYANLNGYDGKQIQVTIADPSRPTGPISVFLDLDMDGAVDKTLFMIDGVTTESVSITATEQLLYDLVIGEIAESLKLLPRA